MKFKKKHFIITAAILFLGIVVACGFHGFRDRGMIPAFAVRGRIQNFSIRNFQSMSCRGWMKRLRI